jgi:predicted permease
VRAFYRQLLERTAALPGVRDVAAGSRLPLGGAGSIVSFSIEGRERPQGEVVEDLVVKSVSPEYFRTLGIALRGGRAFEERDREGAPVVMILNEAAVRRFLRFLPDGRALGRRVQLDMVIAGQPLTGEVVGVVANTAQFGLDQEARPEVYVPHRQAPFRSLSVVLRAAGDPLALAGAVRREVRSLDADLPLDELRTMEQVVSESVARPRFFMSLLTIFAAVALALAAIGIFGVISYAVAQRTREIGVRMALGARPAEVVRMVVGRAAALAGIGAAIGLVAAAAATRLLSSLLYGVSPTDPATFGGVALVLGVVTLLASYLPARAAARVDPVVALRQE